jgi:lipopolysaccharide export system permease protein
VLRLDDPCDFNDRRIYWLQRPDDFGVRADGSDRPNERASFPMLEAGDRMGMMTNTLGRYFAGRFVVSALGVFVSIFVLLVLVDYIEMVRKTSGLATASALMVAETSLFRVPQLLEKMMPFCILIGAMTCYLALSRRLELVVARAAGVSAWQFIAPALASAVALGIVATVAYNPISANLRETSKRMEAQLFGSTPGGGIQDAAGFWINQVNSDGQAIINAARSEQQGVRLTGLTVFRFDTDFQFKERIEAQEARLEEGRWLFKSVRRYSLDQPPVDQDSYVLPTSLTPAQVRNSFSTPETVSFWQLPNYIRSSESSGFATAGYRLQYHKLLAQPFLLAAMVMVAAAVSLRFFRFGGVQKMVLSGVGAGFLLYVLSKVTEDLSKAELMHPIASAWLPVCVGGLTGFLALLYQEDG